MSDSTDAREAAEKMREACAAFVEDATKRPPMTNIRLAAAIRALPLPSGATGVKGGEDECPRCLGMKEYFNPATGMRRMCPCPECRGTGRATTPSRPATATGDDGNEVTRARDAALDALMTWRAANWGWITSNTDAIEPSSRLMAAAERYRRALAAERARDDEGRASRG